MTICEKNNNIILTDTVDFDLHHIFDCGQCFRYEKLSENTYLCITRGHVLQLEQHEHTVVLYNTTYSDYTTIWEPYFDFGRDYGKIKQTLSRDCVMKTAISYGEGIRILRQDLWECMISFIISASNNIPRIKKIIALLCKNFGEPIIYMKKTYYTFPSPEKIASLTLSDLQVIKAGYRDKYIMDAAMKVANGILCLDALYSASPEQAKQALMSVNGIGNKVSDCILLFGLAKHDSFPVDVWIKRIMEYCYFNDEQKISDIISFAREKFGDLSGFAQQYLFFYARENKIDT